MPFADSLRFAAPKLITLLPIRTRFLATFVCAIDNLDPGAQGSLKVQFEVRQAYGLYQMEGVRNCVRRIA